MKRVSDKYYALRQYGEEPVFECVDGYPMRIKGFCEFEFFFYYHDQFESYHVIEATTGQAVGGGDHFHQIARQVAIEILNRNGVEGLKEVVNESISQYGLSPRYREATP